MLLSEPSCLEFKLPKLLKSVDTDLTVLCKVRMILLL